MNILKLYQYTNYMKIEIQAIYYKMCLESIYLQLKLSYFSLQILLTNNVVEFNVLSIYSYIIMCSGIAAKNCNKKR